PMLLRSRRSFDIATFGCRLFFFFFFQAEDGIRDATVTGVQTCALPIFQGLSHVRTLLADALDQLHPGLSGAVEQQGEFRVRLGRSEERRVGKECRCGWWAGR